MDVLAWVGKNWFHVTVVFCMICIGIDLRLIRNRINKLHHSHKEEKK